MKILKTLFCVLLFSFQSFAQVSWEEIVPWTVSPQSLSVSRDGNVFIISDFSLIRSTDHGHSWDSISLAPAAISDFATSPTGPIYLFNDSLRKSTDEGNSWITVVRPYNPYEIKFLITNNLGDIFTQPGYTYYCCNTFRSTDEGNSWDLIGIDSSIIIYITFKDDLTFAIFLGQYNGLYKSYDNGDTWEILSNAPTYLHTLFASENGKLIVGRYHNYGNPPGNLFMSSDNGNSWKTISEFNNISVRDIEENQFGHIFVATISGVYRSTDDGVSWQQINSGLNYVWCQKLAIDSSGYVYVTAGSSQSLYRTINTTIPVELISFSAKQIDDKVHLNWQTATELNNRGFEIERKIENNEWRTIGFKEGKGTTTETQNYQFIHNISDIRGTSLSYRLKQIDYDGTFDYSKTVEVEVLVINNFLLQQNYPNPFNPVTTIKYELSEKSFVTLKVYDVLGNEISTLDNEEKSAGSYKINFDARDFPSGIYFYSLKAGSLVETKKMVLLR